MKRRQYVIASVCAVMMALTAGCGVAVKDTAGIKQYFEDQGKAEILAVQIKADTPDKNSDDYKNAEKLYNRAAGAGNGWTSGIVFDAKTKHQINVSLDDYADSDVGKAMMQFLALGEPSSKSFDPTIVAAVADFALALIDKIEQQNNLRVELAVNQLQQEFSRSRWTTFDNTTVLWLDEKYKFKNPEN